MKIEIPLLVMCALAGFAPAQNRTAEFERKFRAAREINSKDEMAKLVRLYQEEVVPLVVLKCEAIPNGAASQHLEEELAALREAWKTALDSRFVGNYYEYCSLIDQQTWRERTRLGTAYLRAFNKYQENLEAKDGPKFELLSGELATLAVNFNKVGDLYYSARSWGLVGRISDDELRGDTADLYRACGAYKSCVETCDKLGLNDRWYQSVKQRYDFLERNGYAGPPPDPNAPPPGAAVEAAGATAIVATMQFEALPELDAFERPSYFADDVYQIWPSVYMRQKGSTGNFVTLGSQPLILRAGSSALELDIDGDGTGEQKVPSKGNRALVEFPLGEGEEERSWAFLTEVGVQKDTYQGLQYNLQNSDEVFNLYFVNAASLVGTLEGIPVRVIDDNMDGLYGSEEKSWNWVGLAEGHPEPEIDSIVIGESKRARPWSELQEIGGQWYKLEATKAGMALSATPVEVETGLLQLSYKGEVPAFVVVRGQKHISNCFFDLRQNGRGPIAVPIGEYQLSFGILRKGKKAQTLKALMLPGEDMPTWKVEAGETVKVELGKPFGFAFEYEEADGTLTVKGKSIKITGSGGEIYTRMWNCVPKPAVSYRKAGSKRGTKPESMDAVLDIYERDEEGFYKYDQTSTFFPVDTTFDIKWKTGERAEVQLIEKKNKLFKAIESDWK